MILLLVLTMVQLYVSEPKYNYYPETMVVVETYNHELLLQDSNGNQWDIYVEDNDWMIGDGASLIIYDNGTQTIYDDVIVDIKYLNLGGLIND